MYVVAMTPAPTGGQAGPRGDERYAENLAKAVALAGGGEVEVNVVSPGTQASTVELAPGVLRTYVPMSPADDPRHAVGWGMEAAVRGAGLVHVHASFTRFGQAAVLAAGVNRVPTVVSDQGAPSLSSWARAEMRECADLVLACSVFGARMAGGAATVVPGAVDAQWFSPAPGGRERSGFACVGRVVPHKRIERAVDRLPAGARLVICGEAADDGYLKELHDLAEDREVELVHGADDEAVRDLYRSVRAVVVATEHLDGRGTFLAAPEVLSLVVLEAAACGTPAVVAATGALPELVVDGRTGFVVHDDEELGAALDRLHADPGLSAGLGAAARNHLLGRWDLPTAGQVTLDLYRQAVERYRAEDDL